LKITSETVEKNLLEITENQSNTVVLPLEILRDLQLTSEGYQGIAATVKTLSRHTVVSETNDDPLILIDASQGSLYHIVLSQNASVSFVNFSASSQYSQRITIYLQQDSEGNSSITQWPANVLWNDGSAPQINAAAFAYTRIMLDTVDGGTTIFGNWSVL
jgi:hypothetical protein